MSEIEVKMLLIAPKYNITNRVAPQGNNISSTDVNSALGSPYDGATPFILGASKLGSGDYYLRKNWVYNGFFDSNITTADGLANCTLTISGNNIDNFVLRFDQVARQWATEIKVDNIVYFNNNNEFVWKGASANTHTIQIIRWNKALYPIRITSITDGVGLNFNRSDIKEIVRGSQVVAENDLPKYGTICQYGNINFYDNDGVLNQLAENGILLRNQLVEIYSDGIIIGKFLSEKWDVDNDIVKVELKDDISSWDYIDFDGYQLKENSYLSVLFSDLNKIVNDKIQMSYDDNVYLMYCPTKYLYLEKSTFRQAIDKFCQIAQMNIYQKENGEIWAITV